MCSFGKDKCDNGICKGRTDAPTSVPTVIRTAIPTAVPTGVPASLPTGVPTSLPAGVPSALPTGVPTSTVIPSTDASPTSAQAENQTVLVVGVGAGCLVVGLVVALYFTGRLKFMTGGASGGVSTAALTNANEVQQETAAKQLASDNPGFDRNL